MTHTRLLSSCPSTGRVSRGVLGWLAAALVAFGCSTASDAPELAASASYDLDPAKDPIGFGVGGTLQDYWATDGRAWAYNWGWDPGNLDTKPPGSALYLPMIWGGPFCAGWGDLKRGRLQADVDRYRRHVCADARCKFDARSVYRDYAGTRREVIFSAGRRVDFLPGSDSPAPAPRELTSMWRYCGQKDASGACTDRQRACFGKKASECVFDSFTVISIGRELWESISTPDGRYYNLELDTGAVRSTGRLADVARYCGQRDAQGVCNDPKRPCFGKTALTCRFDTRAVTPAYESITAQGRYYNFTRGTDDVASTARLETVDRYRYGACLGTPPGQDCVLDSRTVFSYDDGTVLESISSVGPDGQTGMYANWDKESPGQFCAPNDPSLEDYWLGTPDANGVRRRGKLEYINKHGGPGQRWLIFNEPDVATQSHMPAQHAAKLYALLDQKIRSADPGTKLYCCGTSPDACTGPHCKSWIRDFANALPAGVAPDAIHYHNYAHGPNAPPFLDHDGKTIIAGMKAFSDEMQRHPKLKDKGIVISEWGGLTNDTARRCAPASPNNRDDVLLPVAEWLRTEGKRGYRFQAAAWFMDYCKDGSNCSRGSILYDSPMPDAQCGTGCQNTCLGDAFFNQVAGTW